VHAPWRSISRPSAWWDWAAVRRWRRFWASISSPGPFAIGLGMTALIVVLGPIASLAIWSIRKPYRIVLDQAEARETA
jgi:hypothetical protein